jgi:putative PIN family toxin of toxin-antitoxin system
VLVVLDSNVLLSAIGPNSPFRKIWTDFLESKFHIAVNEDILKEYEEILQEHASLRSAKLVLEIFEESANVWYQRVSYKWGAIKKDPDDNKFFDVAVASSADYLVTNDKHFKVAKQLPFPKVNIISSEEFMRVLA